MIFRLDTRFPIYVGSLDNGGHADLFGALVSGRFRIFGCPYMLVCPD